ncbi:MAG: glycosyltransferase, partial [Prevotella sp.]|nr:glycosyltransferase [Prevotella sp.]
PSECYENNPLAAIEALCLGTPVLGARIGGIPELIKPGSNGLVFASGDPEDLANKIEEMYRTTFDNRQIALQACGTYNAETYYKRLTNIYKGQVYDGE